jgi:hypothetical protein
MQPQDESTQSRRAVRRSRCDRDAQRLVHRAAAARSRPRERPSGAEALAAGDNDASSAQREATPRTVPRHDMLTPLLLKPVQVDRTRYPSSAAARARRSGEAGGDLVPAVLTIVRKLGFDGFFMRRQLSPAAEQRRAHPLFHDAEAGMGDALRPAGVRGVRSRGCSTRSKARCRSSGTALASAARIRRPTLS